MFIKFVLRTQFIIVEHDGSWFREAAVLRLAAQERSDWGARSGTPRAPMTQVRANRPPPYPRGQSLNGILAAVYAGRSVSFVRMDGECFSVKVLQVIHGYPPRYNAGSEVYTQTLCHALAGRCEVCVFTREEDSFARDFGVRCEVDGDCSDVALRLVNCARYKDRYRAAGVDRAFAEVLGEFAPDLVHVGHLNHLSTSLVEVAAGQGMASRAD